MHLPVPAALSAAVPSISPVPAGIRRPFWSVMIPTYNSTQYLQEALESVLVQDPGTEEMQIEIVDDCSTKADPQAVLAQMGVTERVGYFRHPRNVGIGGNWNACIERAAGHCVHILHSDDLVRPGFYCNLREAMEKHPDAGAASCRTIFMEEDGNWLRLVDLERRTAGYLSDWVQKITTIQRLQCPSVVVRRDTYEKLGGFRQDLCYALDWEMWIRIAVFFPVWYEPTPLAFYRVRVGSATGAIMESGMDIPDERHCLHTARNYLPADVAKPLTEKALETVALKAIEYAKTFLRQARLLPAVSQVREAWKCSHRPAVIWAVICLPFWYPASLVRRSVRKFRRR